MRVDCGYRADVIVAEKVVVEVKAVESLTDLHKAQLLTYLRITGKKVGLILNFNTAVLKDGIVRLVLMTRTIDFSVLSVPPWFNFPRTDHER